MDLKMHSSEADNILKVPKELYSEKNILFLCGLTLVGE